MTPANNGAAVHDIERIVREVMSRLAAAGQSEPPSEDEDTRQLRMTGQVVSLAELEGKLSGVSGVVVSSGTVITPAARDYLRECNVRVSRGSGRPPLPSQTATILVAAAETTFDPVSLVSRLRNGGVDVAGSGADDLPSTIAGLVEAIVKRKTSALLLTGQPAVALCLANRQRGVRACTGQDEEDVRRAATATGANLLVLEPRGRSTFQLTRLADAFIDAGPNECPAAYQELLG